jgi:predicted amidophosphoribosyltransferase
MTSYNELCPICQKKIPRISHWACDHCMKHLSPQEFNKKYIEFCEEAEINKLLAEALEIEILLNNQKSLFSSKDSTLT